MRDNSIINIAGSFMAIDFNIEHLIGYIKVCTYNVSLGLHCLFTEIIPTEGCSWILGLHWSDCCMYQASDYPKVTSWEGNGDGICFMNTYQSIKCEEVTLGNLS